MSMTKKDYELIASEIEFAKINFVDNATGDKPYDNGKYDTWYVMAINLATTLKNNNPKFDRERFLEACGVTSKEAN